MKIAGGIDLWMLRMLFPRIMRWKSFSLALDLGNCDRNENEFYEIVDVVMMKTERS